MSTPVEEGTAAPAGSAGPADSPEPVGTSVLYEAIREVAARQPRATAIRTTDGARLEYADLLPLVDRYAAGLRAHGVRAADGPQDAPADGAPDPAVVAFQLENGIGYVAALLAVARLGARYVPLLSNFDADDVATALERTSPGLLVTDGRRPLAPAAAALPRVSPAELGTATPLPAPADGAEVPCHSGVFRMLWTSGSTEFPKLMAWRQDKFRTERLRWIADTGIEHADVFFCRHPLDVAHATDLHMFAALLSGAELVIADPYAPAEELLRQLERSGATVMSALPQHYSDLIDAGVRARAAGAGPDLTRLRRPLCGGAYLGPEVMRRADEVLDIRIRQIYGSTEFGLALGNMDDVVQAGVGQRPVAGVEVRLEPLVADGPSDIGELVLLSDCTSEGYLHHAEANARTFRGAEFWTGDVARRAADGGLEILGRTSEALAGTGGPVVAPMLDDEIHGTGLVTHAVSLPVRPGAYGSEVYVTLRAAEGRTEPEVRQAVEEVLRSHGLRGELRLVDEIPLTPVGKVNKPLLRSAFEGREGRPAR